MREILTRGLEALGVTWTGCRRWKNFPGASWSGTRS